MPDVPRIFIDLPSIFTRRKVELTRIFSKISIKGLKVNFVHASIGGSIICGFSDSMTPGTEFKSWRFKTMSPDIIANYHEIWNQYNKNQYFLVRAYLHLFKKTEDRVYEYIHLHCDASEPDNSPHAEYKKSLHIHVEAAEDPIPKAHIALYNGRPEILTDLRTFNTALNDSVVMIESQVLRRLQIQ